MSVLKKDGSDVLDAVVTLNAKMEGDKLSFDVEVLMGSLEGADGPASTFIDIIGMPFTPRSLPASLAGPRLEEPGMEGPSRPEPPWHILLSATSLRPLPVSALLHGRGKCNQQNERQHQHHRDIKGRRMRLAAPCHQLIWAIAWRVH